MAPIEAFFAFVIYFAPTIIAFGRGLQRRWWLVLVLALTGWMVIGWVGCFIWAFVGKSRKQVAKDTAAEQYLTHLERELAAARAQPVQVHVHNKQGEQ